MFGADTNLVFDAIQMVAVAAAFTGGAVYLIMRRKRASASAPDAQSGVSDANGLEERVRVLERIATDPATRLADEFERLEQEDKSGKERV